MMMFELQPPNIFSKEPFIPRSDFLCVCIPRASVCGCVCVYFFPFPFFFVVGLRSSSLSLSTTMPYPVNSRSTSSSHSLMVSQRSPPRDNASHRSNASFESSKLVWGDAMVRCRSVRRVRCRTCWWRRAGREFTVHQYALLSKVEGVYVLKCNMVQVYHNGSSRNSCDCLEWASK